MLNVKYSTFQGRQAVAALANLNVGRFSSNARKGFECEFGCACNG